MKEDIKDTGSVETPQSRDLMTNNDSPPVDSADPMLRDKTGFIDRSLDLRKTSQGWAKAVNARNRILGRSRS